MGRRCRVGVILAVLTLHVATPFAAYTRAEAPARYGDYCSVYRNAPPQAPAMPSLPAGKHLTTHCAYCPGGSATVAIAPPTAFTVLHAQTAAELPLAADVWAYSSARVVLPPSRAPPPDQSIDLNLS